MKLSELKLYIDFHILAGQGDYQVYLTDHWQDSYLSAGEIKTGWMNRTSIEDFVEDGVELFPDEQEWLDEMIEAGDMVRSIVLVPED